jgi:hypothetical protein
LEPKKEIFMAGLAHLSIGLASKRMAPKVPLGILITCSYAIDLGWGICFLTGIEHLPQPGVVKSIPYSHSLIVAILMSGLAGGIAWLLCRNRRTSVIIGVLVFSHWIVDFITKPMTAVFPGDIGIPLFFEGSPLVGLGLYSTKLGVNIGEYGSFILGVAIYLLTLKKLRNKRLSPAQM